MRFPLAFFCAVALPLSLFAQGKATPTPKGKPPEATPKPAATPKPVPKADPTPKPEATPARKTMTFQPGSRTPDDQEESPAATPAPRTTTGASKGDPCFDIAASFFESLKRGLIDDAYANLTKGSKIGDRPEELRSLKTKTSEAISLFGEIRGFEVIESKSVGSMLRRYTIVSFGRDFPLRWRFYFYKADDVWRLVDLHVDDRLNGIFQEKDEPGEPKQ